MPSAAALIPLALVCASHTSFVPVMFSILHYRAHSQVRPAVLACNCLRRLYVRLPSCYCDPPATCRPPKSLNPAISIEHNIPALHMKQRIITVRLVGKYIYIYMCIYMCACVNLLSTHSSQSKTIEFYTYSTTIRCRDLSNKFLLERIERSRDLKVWLQRRGVAHAFLDVIWGGAQHVLLLVDDIASAAAGKPRPAAQQPCTNLAQTLLAVVGVRADAG